MRRKILLGVVCVMIIALFAPIYVSAADDVRIFIDGEELITDVPPRIINGRTMIPVRAVTEAIDCTVVWFEPERRVDLYSPYTGQLFLSMFIDNPVVEHHGYGDTDLNSGVTYMNEETIEAAPVIIDSRTLVPLRLIAEALGFKVDWDGTARTAYIQSMKLPTPAQAKEYLYNENYINSDIVLFYPGELNRMEDGALCYGFAYGGAVDGGYFWVNSITCEVVFATEVTNYTGEDY